MKIRYVKVENGRVRSLPERLKDDATHELNLSNANFDLTGCGDYFVLEDGVPRIPTSEELEARSVASYRVRNLQELKEQRNEELASNTVSFNGIDIQADKESLFELRELRDDLANGSDTAEIYSDYTIIELSKQDLTSIVTTGKSQLRQIHQDHIQRLKDS